jgi:hypothetical protein
MKGEVLDQKKMWLLSSIFQEIIFCQLTFSWTRAYDRVKFFLNGFGEIKFEEKCSIINYRNT